MYLTLVTLVTCGPRQTGDLYDSTPHTAHTGTVFRHVLASFLHWTSSLHTPRPLALGRNLKIVELEQVRKIYHCSDVVKNILISLNIVFRRDLFLQLCVLISVDLYKRLFKKEINNYCDINGLKCR